MYKVIIAMETVGQAKSLAEACQLFFQEIKKMMEKEGGCAVYVLYEACMIETVIDGARGIMNYNAIIDFSIAVGILDKDGSLRNKPVPYIPKDIAREVLVAAHNNSLAAYVAEHAETLARLMNEQPGQKVPEPPTNIIITT